ncbi:MAG TPA: hypothetical protein VN229_16720 [Terriglobales bacterium]|nr:hypothetical protein [Terriglobales bacterium]
MRASKRNWPIPARTVTAQTAVTNKTLKPMATHRAILRRYPTARRIHLTSKAPAMMMSARLAAFVMLPLFL